MPNLSLLSGLTGRYRRRDAVVGATNKCSLAPRLYTILYVLLPLALHGVENLNKFDVA